MDCKISFSQKGHKPQGKKLSCLARREFSRSCKTSPHVKRVTTAVCHPLAPWKLREAQLIQASSVSALCGHSTSEKILCAWLIKSGLLSNFRVGVVSVGCPHQSGADWKCCTHLFQRKEGRPRLEKGGRGPKTPPLLFSIAFFPDRWERPCPQKEVVVPSGGA